MSDLSCLRGNSHEQFAQYLASGLLHSEGRERW